jgi:hypothetical protein
VIAFAVLPVFAVLVAAPAGPDEGCPSARQVTDAMLARFPTLLVATPTEGQPTRPDVLRARLDVAGDGTVVRFSLVDVRGDMQLRRALPAPGRGQSMADCLALADTLAAIVERYLGAIGPDPRDVELSPVPVAPSEILAVPLPAPPPPPPPPRARLFLFGLGWRMPSARPAGQAEQGEIEARLAGELELTRTVPRVAVIVSGGASPGIDAPIAAPGPRTATLRRFPLRLGGLLELPAGAGWIEPTILAGTDLLVVSLTAPASRFLLVGYAVEAAVGYRLKVAGRFHLRPRGGIGLAIKRWDIGPREQRDTIVLSTPRVYASFGIDMGVIFQ